MWEEHGVHSAQHLHLQGRLQRIQLSHGWEHFRLVVFCAGNKRIKWSLLLPSQPCADLTARTRGSACSLTCVNVPPATAGPPARRVTSARVHSCFITLTCCSQTADEYLCVDRTPVSVCSELRAAVSTWRHLCGQKPVHLPLRLRGTQM